MVAPSIGADGELLPFYKYILSWWFSSTIRYATKWTTISVEFCASLRLLYFISVFCSLLINTRLVFISYFVSVPLRNVHRSLEYQCSFVPLYLLLFAFLIICIETFCIFDYLYWGFWFFVDCFVILPPSFGKSGPQSDTQVSRISE